MSAKPGDDFFRYVNGAWMDRTEIPADRVTLGHVRDPGRESRARCAKRSSMKSLRAGGAPGSNEQKIARLLQFLSRPGRHRRGGASAERKPISTAIAAIAHARGRRAPHGAARHAGGLPDRPLRERSMSATRTATSSSMTHARALACRTANIISATTRSSRRSASSSAPTSRQMLTAAGQSRAATPRRARSSRLETADRTPSLAAGSSAANAKPSTICATARKSAPSTPRFPWDAMFEVGRTRPSARSRDRSN